MNGPLQLRDHSARSPNAFLHLDEILAVLPPRAARSKWSVRPFVADGEPLLWVTTNIDRESSFDRLAATGERVSFERLCTIAGETMQVIWGAFDAFDGEGGDTPWLTLSAVDSSYWVVDTDDLKVRRRVERAFRDITRVA